MKCHRTGAALIDEPRVCDQKALPGIRNRSELLKGSAPKDEPARGGAGRLGGRGGRGRLGHDTPYANTVSRRLISSNLGCWVDPAVAFEALYAGAQTAFWLDSGPDAVVGMSYIGAAASSAAGRLGASAVDHAGAAVLDDIEKSLAVERGGAPGFGFGGFAAAAAADAAAAAAAGLPAFQLGWVGWLAYDVEDSRFMFVDRAIAFDHAARTVTLLALAEDDEAPEPWLEATAEQLRVAGNRGVDHSGRFADSVASASTLAAPAARWRHSPPEYLRLVRECQRLIGEGDAYQLCLTNEVTVAVHPEPLATYRALRAANPTHHGGFMRFGEMSLLSSSPEQFLEVTAGGAITTKPIKGTRPRGSTPESDAALRDELRENVKERAENVMIVDLMRNDLGRVAQTGTVRVTALFEVESFSTVHQLVSTVTAQLADGLTGVDAVRASFPAGSMTGAPKISAMQILNRLERGRRGIYAGAFGYFGLDGRVDLAMSIRSIVLSPTGASIGTGGGITALSVPEDELAEIEVKAAPLLAVLGVVDARG
ncbi:hypothetical protein GCM10011399_36690 [Subtercola lobariae]|uniref:Chorismate-utilising enzyme C-terminal domain-containing protein n=1 Tax=Subtercola lobariae TaxID=1588641 RepID=A0A917BHV2_9MICO|nr:hypothetical protein GCM10011399_36690 [Subtercola lobariae]